MGVRNLAAFNAVITKSAENLTKKELSVFVRKIALDVLRGVIEKTPVDTGRARANWQLAIGSPIGSILPEPRSSGADAPTEGAGIGPAGAANISSGLETLGALKLNPFQIVFITNNVSYIEVLEEGSSEQAQQGMVAMTLEEVRSEFGE